MRVRSIRLRILAAAAALLWAVAAAAVVAAYRTTGPMYQLVAATPLVGLAASLVALAWPPLVRGHRASVGVAWVGIGTLLLLAPSAADLVTEVVSGASRPLLPSAEAAYGWFLALAGTALFAGLGISRRVLGATSIRRARLALASLIAVAVLAVGSGVSGMAVLATQLAAASPAAASDWGPADPDLVPPTCSSPLKVAASAEVAIRATSAIDGRGLGSVSLTGVRSGDDETWQAEIQGWPVEGGPSPSPDAAPANPAGSPAGSIAGTNPATSAGVAPAIPSPAPSTRASPPGSGAPAASGAAPALSSQLAYTRVQSSAWLRLGGGAWQSVPLREELTVPVENGMPPVAPIELQRKTLDTAVIVADLSDAARLAAEDVGIELVGGVRARHCRLLTGGILALQGFRPLRWLIGQPPLSDEPTLDAWRGSLDWWVFADSELGMATVAIEGLPAAGWPAGLQGTLDATLTARDRGSPQVVEAPAP